MINAVKNGKSEVVELARSMNPPCDWNEQVTAAAAQYKEFGIIKWLLAKGCPFDHRVTYSAAKNGCLEILKYIIENYNFRVGPGVYTVAKRNNQISIIEYLFSINAPTEYDPGGGNHVDDEDYFIRRGNIDLMIASQSEEEELFIISFPNIENTLFEGARNTKRTAIYLVEEDDKYVNDDDDDEDDNDFIPIY
jgi:hypothetical protein